MIEDKEQPLESDLPRSEPDALGFSPERLKRLHAEMQRLVDDRELSGIVTLLARHGKVVEERVYGSRDTASNAPMAADTIFRIFSMTKPITAAAMMILYEQDKWRPSDLIAKHIPEFAQLKVFKGIDSKGEMLLEDPAHPPSMGELMCHTAGFTYGVFGATAVDRMYEEQQILQSHCLEMMIDNLAKVPLLYQPGTRWEYSVSSDIQGYLIEKLSGHSLPDFLRLYLFAPLNMSDTDFYVSQEKWHRFATLYEVNEEGAMVASSPDSRFAAHQPGPRGAADWSRLLRITSALHRCS